MSWRDNSTSSTRSGSPDSGKSSGAGAGTAGGGDRGGGNYTFSRTPEGKLGNWNTGGRAEYTGSMSRGLTPIGARRTAVPVGPQGNPRMVLPVVRPPIPPVQPPVPMVQPPVQPVAQRPVGYPPVDSVSRLQNYLQEVAHVRNVNQNFPGQPATYAGSTHYKTSDPASGSFKKGDPSVNYGNDQYGSSIGGAPAGNRPGGERGGGGGGLWKRGGNVDRPSVLKQIQARSKRTQAIDTSRPATKKAGPAPARKPLSKVTQRVTNKKPPTKTPWKRGTTTPAFAKGGAVEKFMARYPNFKLA